MHVPVDLQVWRLAVLSLIGIATDLSFHVYRAYRSVFRPKNTWHHLLDGTIALITLVLIGTAIYVVNWGEIRLYIPLSLIGGFYTGNLLVGDWAYRIARKSFLRIRYGIHWTQTRVIDPPKRAVRKAFRNVTEALAHLASLPPEDPPVDPADDSTLEPTSDEKPDPPATPPRTS